MLQRIINAPCVLIAREEGEIELEATQATKKTGKSQTNSRSTSRLSSNSKILQNEAQTIRKQELCSVRTFFEAKFRVNQNRPQEENFLSNILKYNLRSSGKSMLQEVSLPKRKGKWNSRAHDQRRRFTKPKRSSCQCFACFSITKIFGKQI